VERSGGVRVGIGKCREGAVGLGKQLKKGKKVCAGENPKEARAGGKFSFFFSFPLFFHTQDQCREIQRPHQDRRGGYSFGILLRIIFATPRGIPTLTSSSMEESVKASPLIFCSLKMPCSLSSSFTPCETR